VSNPLLSRPGAASITVAIMLWMVLLVAIISAGEFTSMW
jgi:hypothetical protein